jgi:NAD(P)-dependent dehydrogenase (short-subunit alcohol dehydrogenase family)
VADARHAKRRAKKLTSMFDLSGRVAVITGGNGGIGLGTAQALALSGCNVAIWGRNADKNKDAAWPRDDIGFLIPIVKELRDAASHSRGAKFARVMPTAALERPRAQGMPGVVLHPQPCVRW